MKFTGIIFALSIASGIAFANPAPQPKGAAAAAPSDCYWDGTAPFCAGSCPDGYTEENRGSVGDGAACWTGYKVYCCKEAPAQ